MNDLPLVSISCITYNHASYIKECIDGFLMQKTNFNFEILIHDDHSTDGTEEIIKEYAKQYPDIIKPLFEKENQYSLGKPTGSVVWNLPRAKGKYIAMCEGDDYWIDPYKLQKQVDFLESHPDYSLCFHAACIKNEAGTSFHYPEVENREYNSIELFDNWIVPTASIVVRSSCLNVPVDSRFISGDIIMILNAANKGKIWGFRNKMSVYRVQNNGLTISRLNNPISHYKKEFNHYKAIGETFPKLTHKCINKKLANTAINWGLCRIRKGNILGFYNILSALFLSPTKFFNRLKNIAK